MSGDPSANPRQFLGKLQKNLWLVAVTYMQTFAFPSGSSVSLYNSESWDILWSKIRAFKLVDFVSSRVKYVVLKMRASHLKCRFSVLIKTGSSSTQSLHPLLLIGRSVISDSLQPHELQHT